LAHRCKLGSVTLILGGGGFVVLAQCPADTPVPRKSPKEEEDIYA